MKAGLALFALLAFASLAGVSVWATGHVALGPVVRDLLENPAAGGNPWFVATLFDAYFGFLWLWLWVAYKETSWILRIVWLVLILFLGNMGIAAYVLLQILRLPTGATPRDLLLRRS